jgi:hypothetical protein
MKSTLQLYVDVELYADSADLSLDALHQVGKYVLRVRLGTPKQLKVLNILPALQDGRTTVQSDRTIS